MHKNYALVGEHVFEIQTDSAHLMKMYTDQFRCTKQAPQKTINMSVVIRSGSGISQHNTRSGQTSENKRLIFRQNDYLIDCDSQYQTAFLYVYSSRALRMGFNTLYCLFITHCGWGIMIRGNSVEDGGAVRITTGNSDFPPDPDVHDTPMEAATMIKISEAGATVFNASVNGSQVAHFPLSSIQLSHQSFQEGQFRLTRTNALLQLIDYVLCWPSDADQMKKIIAMLKQLVAVTPTYNLYCKDRKSGEMIS
jgi:hypothetical protein